MTPLRIIPRLHLIIPALIILLVLTSCATVPVTGRQGLSIMSDSQLASMAVEQYSDVLKKSKLSQDKAKVAMVRRVGHRLAKSAEQFLVENGMGVEVENYNWEFNLIEDDDMINAWAMPGGKTAIYTGILPITQSETGLAVVMGHEIAHSIAHHGNERMSQQLLAAVGGVVLAVTLKDQPSQTRNAFMMAYGAGATLGLVLPYSRLHESEADYIGLVIMARAGYDPREAIPFWQRMENKGGAKPPEFLSTHPAPQTRVDNLKRLTPQAMKYYKPQES